MFWAYLAVWVAAMVVGILAVDPSLIAERMRPGPGGKDYALVFLMTPLMVGQLVVAGLDVGRYHFSDHVPLLVQVIGLLAMAGAIAVLIWAEAVNRFFSSVIRIQTERGHHVITTGPYRYLPSRLCEQPIPLHRRRVGPGLVVGGIDRLDLVLARPGPDREKIASSTQSSRAMPSTPRRYATGCFRAFGDRSRVCCD